MRAYHKKYYRPENLGRGPCGTVLAPFNPILSGLAYLRSGLVGWLIIRFSWHLGFWPYLSCFLYFSLKKKYLTKSNKEYFRAFLIWTELCPEDTMCVITKSESESSTVSPQLSPSPARWRRRSSSGTDGRESSSDYVVISQIYDWIIWNIFSLTEFWSVAQGQPEEDNFSGDANASYFIVINFWLVDQGQLEDYC